MVHRLDRCQLKLPLMPVRPGVLNRISDLCPRPLSARLFFGSGLNGSLECSHWTVDQSIFGQSGCAAYAVVGKTLSIRSPNGIAGGSGSASGAQIMLC